MAGKAKPGQKKNPLKNYVRYNEKRLRRGKKILGIDPSFTSTGLCLTSKDSTLFVESFTTVNTDFLEVRINKIIDRIKEVIKKYKVEQVCIEGLSFGSKFASGRQLAGLFFIIICELDRLGIDYDVIPPTSLKLAATGDGRADKEFMCEVVEIEERIKMGKMSELGITSKRFTDIIDAYHLSKYPYVCKDYK